MERLQLPWLEHDEPRPVSVRLHAAAKTGSYMQAVLIAFEILQAIANSMPEAAFNIAPKVHSYGVVVASAREDDLIAELDGICQDPSYGTQASAPVDGPLVTILTPIVLALIKKWLSSL